MNTRLWVVFCLAAMVALVGCQKQDVPSGTYKGTISKVNPDEKEIYVTTEDGKELELYFTDDTQVLSGEDQAAFDVLAEEQDVVVVVENVDGRLVPVSVTVVEVAEMVETPSEEESSDMMDKAADAAKDATDAAGESLEDAGEAMQDVADDSAASTQPAE